ncbi:MAG: UDP-3-O-(3-hydroxymyristoyl)glucosamine N-acyltransferase [Candidatus Neomarinimicrobiota bacterium]
MSFTLNQIAKIIGGNIIGDSKCLINGVSEIQNSKPGTITFLGNPIYKKYLSRTSASAIILSDRELLKGRNGIVVTNPQLAIAKVLNLFFNEKPLEPSIHPKAIISKSANIGDGVSIEAGVVVNDYVSIGDRSFIGSNTVIGSSTIIGKNCKVLSNVTLYDKTILGENIIIHSGSTIGSDGYGYVTINDKHEKIPQTGNVIIGDNVEIGSNCAIDRATIGNTIIGEMTKIDNLVHIAHNVKIGKGCLLTSGFAIAGSAEVGDYCTFAGQVGVAPHVKIGNRSIFAAKSGVTKSLKGNKVYAGFPAIEIKDYNKRLAAVNEIKILRKKFDELIQINRNY